MKEKLISFETAKLAKEKGFNELCYSFYQSEDCLLKDCFEYNSSYKYYNSEYKPSPDNPEWFLANACSAPTQSLLQKWLRKVYKIFVTVSIPYEGFGNYSSEVWGVNEEDGTKMLLVDGMTVFEDYEEALEEGLQEALKLI